MLKEGVVVWSEERRRNRDRWGTVLVDHDVTGNSVLGQMTKGQQHLRIHPVAELNVNSTITPTEHSVSP